MTILLPKRLKRMAVMPNEDAIYLESGARTAYITIIEEELFGARLQIAQILFLPYDMLPEAFKEYVAGKEKKVTLMIKLLDLFLGDAANEPEQDIQTPDLG
jgi:hypothetical protein